MKYERLKKLAFSNIRKKTWTGKELVVNTALNKKQDQVDLL